MILKANYEFLFVGRDEGSFLENYTYEVQENRGSAGQVFLCLEIQNNPSEAEAIGEAMFQELKTIFFEETALEGYLRFENALKGINRRLHDFRKGKLNKHIGVIHAVVAAVEHGALYVSQYGDSEAYLIRKRFVSIVSEGLSDPHNKEGDLFTSIANGELEPGDFVLFSTTRLLRYISKLDLSRMVISSNVSRTLSDLRDALSSEILGRIGLIGIATTLVTEELLAAERASEESLGEDEIDDFEGEAVRQPVEAGYTARSYVPRGAALGSAWKYARKYGDMLVQKIRATDLLSKTGSVRRFASQLQYRMGREKGLTKDKILVAFVGIIVLLLVGIWFVRGSQVRNAELLALDTKLQESRQMVSDAESRAQTDKTAAGVILDAAETKAKEVLNTSHHRAKALEILSQIQKTRELLDNIRRVTDAKVVVDLSGAGVGNALGMVAGKDRFFVYEAQKMFEVILDKVQKPLEFDANDPIISSIYFDEKEVPVFFSKSGKVYELANGSLRPMAAQEGSFRKGVQMTDWGSRIYILDPGSDQIWRYPYVKSRGSFGTAEGYKTAGDVKNGAALTIDSSVYVVNNDGSINRFYGGVSQPLRIDRAPFTPMVGPSRIYTDAEMTSLFVVDSAGGKIFVYYKDPKTEHLVYMQQIVIDGVKDIRDVSFDKSTGRLYVLGTDKIYEVQM